MADKEKLSFVVPIYNYRVLVSFFLKLFVKSLYLLNVNTPAKQRNIICHNLNPLSTSASNQRAELIVVVSGCVKFAQACQKN